MIVFLYLFASPALAIDPEADRIADEMLKYAKTGKWRAVERRYVQLLREYPDVLDNESHHLAAAAARESGNLLGAAQRLMRIEEAKAQAGAAIGDLKALEQQTGLVMLTGKELVTSAMPFDPHFRKAVDAACSKIKEEGVFVGLLPAGGYTLDGRVFEVAPGFVWQVP